MTPTDYPSLASLASNANLSAFEKSVLESIDTNEIVELLQAMIQKRSDYPPGDTREVIQVAAEKLASGGLTPRILAKEEVQPNLIAEFGSGEEGPCLTYHAHVDTVQAGDFSRWKTDPFSGEVIDGSVYGRGAGDDKGSAAVQIMAMVTLARAKAALKGKLQLALVSAEESSAHEGTLFLRDEQYIKPDFLLIGEQTHNQIAIAERVACGIDLTVFGKSAHGAIPSAGDNAILKMARVLIYLRQKLFPIFYGKIHPYLPRPTLNIGKIQGGISWSMVPESCKVDMDRRLLPGETREMAMQEIRMILDEYNEIVEPLKYELFSQGEVAPNIETPAYDPFVQAASHALTDLTGDRRDLIGYVQTSDGRWFVRQGIPIVIFGPSDPEVAHAPNEHVSIEQLVEATRFLTLLALRQLQ